MTRYSLNSADTVYNFLLESNYEENKVEKIEIAGTADDGAHTLSFIRKVIGTSITLFNIFKMELLY